MGGVKAEPLEPYEMTLYCRLDNDKEQDTMGRSGGTQGQCAHVGQLLVWDSHAESDELQNSCLALQANLSFT